MFEGRHDGAGVAEKASNGIAFNEQDCELLERMRAKPTYKSLSAAEKAAMDSIGQRLQAVADAAAKSPRIKTPSRTHVSRPQFNGLALNNRWSCIFPANAVHVSTSLQVALIVSYRGAELCLSLGNGKSTTDAPEKRAREAAQWATVQKGLERPSSTSLKRLEEAHQSGWRLRREWRLDGDEDHFAAVNDWLKAVNSGRGGQCISKFWNPEQLGTLGTGLGAEVDKALTWFGPLYDEVAARWAEGATVPAEEFFGEGEGRFASFGEKLEDKGIYLPGTVKAAIEIGLEAQPFVLLAGPTGTGKTQAATAWDSVEGNAVAVVDVQGGWVDSSSAFGFVSPLDRRFVPGPVLTGLMKCLDKQDSRPILVLDEVNVSPPHVYLAPLLAALERAFANGNAEPLTIIQFHDDPEAARVLETAAKQHRLLRVDRSGPFLSLVLDVPPALRIIGTLNFDGSTDDLAPKVLGRSFVVWFDAPQLTPKLDMQMLSRYSEDTTTSAASDIFEALQALRKLGAHIPARNVLRARTVLERHAGIPGIVDILLAGLFLPQLQHMTLEQAGGTVDDAMLDALPAGLTRTKLQQMIGSAAREGFASVWLVA